MVSIAPLQRLLVVLADNSSRREADFKPTAVSQDNGPTEQDGGGSPHTRLTPCMGEDGL